ncbi:MAG: hypothetical protein HKN13_12595, partial [Rhodothermales bacterium]|nr:hypothetical protein [Rhodothermales bacterium]
LTLFLAAFTLTVAGCDDGSQPSASSQPTDATLSWKLDAMPEGAVEVAQAKQSVKEGDQVAVIGRIGGRMEPITASSGLFVIMDPALPACSDNPGDGCTTPWDYCCESQKTIATNAATVQLRDAEGNPIVLAEGELKPLDRVAVVGTVAPRPNDDTLIVHATGVHVVTP